MLLRILALAGLIGWAGPRAAAAGDVSTLVFFGDSLTAGYGLEDPANQAYPALIQKKIDAAGLPWRVVNAGVSGETTADGLRRIDWVLREAPAIFVLALGANDGLRGIDPAVTRAHLDAMIQRVRARRPAARLLLAGMRMPPNLGEDYIRAFDAVFPAVAAADHVRLVPFLLEGVGGRPELNQADGIHPTAAGHAIIAETLWRALAPLLRNP